MKGYYGIVQYMPDRSRQEGVNVGVYVFCEGVTLYAIAKSFKRVFALFPDASPMRVAQYAQGVECGLISCKTLPDLIDYCHTRANDIHIVDPRPMRLLAGPNEELEGLLDRLT